MENKGKVLLQRYELGRLLGQGTFAKVYHARNLQTAKSVAIKVIDKDKVLKAELMDQIKREISVMKLVRHPNIVELYEVMATKSKIYFIMEYLKGGELFKKVAKGRLKEDVARKYFMQLICAVDFIHSRGVCHRDLKPENLLLDEDGNLKVSDFGLSALSDCKRQDGLLHTTCGTPAYVAPEVINRKGYDGAKADIWSCGVILFVLMAGYLPFHDSNLMEMYRKIAKAKFKCPNWFSPEVRGLLSKILDPNPVTRISTVEIMENSWFRKGYSYLQEVNSAGAKEVTPVNANVEFGSLGTSIPEGKQEMMKAANLNAFDIIALSPGFDLSGLFEETYRRQEVRFTFRQSAQVIISNLEDIAKQLKLKVKKNDGGMMKLESSSSGNKEAIAIDVEIFEITPSFHLVEMKASGDTLECQKLLNQGIQPALMDKVWAWQGEMVQQH